MTDHITHPAAAAIARRTLPPVAAPAEVADHGLIRVGAAVGGPAGNVARKAAETLVPGRR